MSETLRILIVDDDPGSGHLQERLLKNRYQLMTVSSGQAALDALTGFLPDLILLDVAMPGLDGYETCRLIRQRQEYDALKILLVSAHATLSERLKGYEVGADDFLAKPFHNQEFRAKVDVFAKLHREKSALPAQDQLLPRFCQTSRKPMDMIISLTELILNDESLPQDVRQKSALIYKNAVELHHRLEKATLLYYLENNLRFHPYPGSLSEHLDSIVNSFHSAAKKKSLRIYGEYAADIQLTADWQILQEAIGYLIDNAIKFTEPGTRVTVSATLDQATCFIRITDEGPGLEPVWREQLSHPLPASAFTGRDFDQGLSLAIVQQAVKRHGGTLTAERPSGKGATLTITLPLNPPI